MKCHYPPRGHSGERERGVDGVSDEGRCVAARGLFIVQKGTRGK